MPRTSLPFPRAEIFLLAGGETETQEVSHSAGQWDSLDLCLMTQDCVLPSAFQRHQAFSRPSAPTHKRKEEAIAPLAAGPAERERPVVFILSRQPAGQGLVGGSQPGSLPVAANGWELGRGGRA